ncbi:hypothetical protein [Legionella spiritensis]|uniref:hypothetical protein n=1 Tax=Legionella spiritensis TaxID=452 RepID=UPI000F6EED57|nr:hypothetical protein [Legionella spiritensis]VEG89823.1 Uncharacterised protein [Legionella spiritensis]
MTEGMNSQFQDAKSKSCISFAALWYCKDEDVDVTAIKYIDHDKEELKKSESKLILSVFVNEDTINEIQNNLQNTRLSSMEIECHFVNLFSKNNPFGQFPDQALYIPPVEKDGSFNCIGSVEEISFSYYPCLFNYREIDGLEIKTVKNARSSENKLQYKIDKFYKKAEFLEKFINTQLEHNSRLQRKLTEIQYLFLIITITGILILVFK